ncbi:Cysteine proteinase inhibitor 4 [Striga hermonthica]|uniref:Cysteine proteinase inhibitor 4 n=1 Tax=Striga hermonthica TaxID=68872 RepID=A0A9N7N082_STRHE|nr:Cysteine proteinase inhibitor 4 [Striga hermonthica]
MTLSSGYFLSMLFSILLTTLVLTEGYNRDMKNLTNPNDPNVLTVAKFAVTKYNMIARQKLNFLTVIKAHKEVLSGMLTVYQLIMTAKNNDSFNPETYYACVRSKARLKNPTLESFF